MVSLHKERIDQHSTSVLMGLTSFAERVDLPGDYCKQLMIAKLSFMVPDEPLHEALAEWIEDNDVVPSLTSAYPSPRCA
jgi:ATP-dependent DNA helicase DinG